jgi:hypothetical protein
MNHPSARLGPRFFRWHRWLAYAVALQVLAWVLGGLVFAWLPFQGWVKGKDWVEVPKQALPADWAQPLLRVAAATAASASPNSISSVATARGPAWRLRGAGGDTWRTTDGQPLPAPDAAAVTRFATSLYRGPGQLATVQQLAEVPRRLGLVREVGEKKDVWQARFDDTLQTRLYVDSRSGELLAVRTEAWVLYDFFWRLHVMDYSEGEDFNNPLLRTASIAAGALVLTGSVLVTLSLARAWRRRQVHRAQRRADAGS